MAVISPILTMVAGLTFFLFGMNVMSQNLEKMAGGKLEKMLQTMTKNPFVSILLGAAITIAVQSSSATTVMLVGLVNSGIMKFTQTIYVLFGANIGTTLTSWILSLAGIQSDAIWLQMLKPKNFSPIFALIGIILMMFSKKNKNKSIANILLGFAVLMVGMTFMTDAVEPLTDNEAFKNILTTFSSPILALLIATVFTGIIQSSAASIGILQALSVTGGITYWIAVPIIMGQNIGTSATGLISCIGTSAKAKRVAIVNLLIKVIGTVILLSLFSVAVYLFNLWDFANSPVNYLKIAIIHTIFNILNTIILMPFEKALISITNKIIPDKGEKHSDEVFVLDERILRSPSVAIGECNNASNRMAEIAMLNLDKSMSLFRKYDEKIAQEIIDNEEIIDSYEDSISSTLVKISSNALSNQGSQNVSKILHAVGDFERLGDHALNLQKVANEMFEKNVSFSDEANSQIRVLEKAIKEIITLTLASYIDDDSEKASLIEPLEQVIDNLTAEIKNSHISRLQSGSCTIEMGFMLSDLITNYERVSDHCSNIAVAVIELRKNTYDAHKYLNDIKYNDDTFKQNYESYKLKYSLS